MLMFDSTEWKTFKQDMTGLSTLTKQRSLQMKKICWAREGNNSKTVHKNSPIELKVLQNSSSALGVPL